MVGDSACRIYYNHSPLALADTYDAYSGIQLSVPASGVMGNDCDENGDTFTAAKVTDPSHGSLSFNANGSFTYTSTPGFTGTDTFTYKISDAMEDSYPATVTITVLPPSDIAAAIVPSPNPVCVNGTITYSVTVSNAGPGGATGVQFSDTLDPSIASPAAVPSQGSCQIDGLTVTCDLGAIATGSNATVAITGQATVPGSVGNFGMATANEPDPNTANNNSTVSSEVNAPNPASPSTVSVADVDNCKTDGVSVTWSSVPGATGYDLKVDSTIVEGVTSPYEYAPGDTNLHFYVVRSKNTCGAGGWSSNTPGTDHNYAPSAVMIDSITDNDPCASGITITYSGGLPSNSYDLLRDGVAVELGISDPVSYNPMDTVQHFYEVRANYLTCSTKSTPQNFTDVSNMPTMPTMDSFGEVDGCVQNGIKIYFTGGTPADRHDLYRDFSLVQSNVTSPVTYDPADPFTHNYQIRTYNGTCWNEPMPSSYADEVSAAPPQPSITLITDADPCDMSGISVSYTTGTPSDRYALYMDGSEVVPAMTGSPYLFLTPDTVTHNYVVRAYNKNCFTASSGVNGTDADNKTVPVITGPHENTCPVKTVTLTTQSGMSNYQWYHGGYPMTGANSDSIVVNEGEDGNYTVSFTNGFGCSAISAEHLVTIWPCPCENPTQEVNETVNTDKSGFSWTAISAEHYRVVRGVLADLPNLKTGAPDFSCYKWGADASLSVNIDADLPQNETGRCYYYLIQGYNCVDPDQFLGPAGEYSQGNQRSVETPSNCD